MTDELRDRLEREGSLDLRVRVRPQAQATRLKERRADGVWKIDIAAAAEDGAANELLRRFVAAEFSVPPSRVEILSGHASREKRVRIVCQNAA